MASDGASRSGSAADSYIGSLISLTSKSEIRYEGILYNINTDESSIGLRNVRSFGTEGRKKDGPQVPPGDKVYDYILFRGTDIKDLQVKSSPPIQPSQPINNDPAIIQSHYSRPVATSTTLSSSVSTSLTDPNSHTAQLGLPGPNFQGNLPLYQPGGNLASWAPTPPPPSANGAGLAMPMYWQGYYGAPNGLPHLHQQSLLRPPPGLPMASSLQQPMQFPNFNPSLPTGPLNLTDVRSPLIPASGSSPAVSCTSLSSATLSSTLPLVPSTSLASETLPAAIPNKAPTASLQAAPLSSGFPSSLSPLATSSPEINAIVPPIINKPNAISGTSLPYQTVSQSTSSDIGTSNSVRSEVPTPSLVTPGQLMQSGPKTVSPSQASQASHKDVEVVQVSSSSPPEPTVPVSAEAQAPILPLPVHSWASQKVSPKPNGAPMQSHHDHSQSYHGYRGRGRGQGTGTSRPVTKFTEDFDFMAMNEKFKKDEVWGHLGKSDKNHGKDKEGDRHVSDEEDSHDEDGTEMSKLVIKPVYNKDDFFDSLSCTTLNNESQNGRTRYSEQIKIDTETFGDFTRHRGGRGGRGPGRGGRFRGGYYGRGYAYGGRGRGRGRSNHAS